MPTPRKVEQLAELKDNFERAQIVIGAQYRGLTVAEMLQMRRSLRDANIEVKVVKNRLARMAAEQAERPELAGIVEGPTALAFAYDEPVAPAKAFKKYLDGAPRAFEVLGAWVDGMMLDRAGLEDFARIPSREELIGQLAGRFQSPLQQFAGLIRATVQDFYGLVEARAQQLDEQGEAA
jgi:large subunit ribosomal protein L10